MKILINEVSYDLKINDTFFKRLFSLFGKKNFNNAYIYQNENKVHTFFTNTLVDIIAIDKKNAVIFKYQNTPKNKIIEVMNEKENTDILILPPNSTKTLKIGDFLTFVNEDII